MTWYALRIEAVGRRRAVIEALLAGGAGAVLEDGEALVAHAPGAAEAEATAAAVRRLEPTATCAIAPVADADWSTAWRARLRAVPVGALTVAPPWEADASPPATTVVIEPGMAFGTGDHASTRGALRLLQDAVPPAHDVADCGTGSAVLAIAAAKRGAARVYAIESDPDALGNAAENIARNGVGDRVHLLEGDARVLLPLVAPVDLVLANILSSVIVPLLPVFRAALRPGGSAVLAGLLDDERDAVGAAIAAGGWDLAGEDSEDAWWSVRIARA